MTTTAYLFSGFPASGKTTALHEAKKAGLKTVEMSAVVRQEFNQVHQGVDSDDNMLGEWADRQRNEYGDSIFARYVKDRIQFFLKHEEGDVAVAGVRSKAEADTFSSFSGIDDVVIVGIRTPSQKRLKRLQERDDVSPSYLEERDERETEWGLQKLLNRYSDVILRNGVCSEERFRSKVRDIVTM